jgi:hypothetical protein
VNIVRDHRHQCAVVASCTRIINADAAKAQRLLYQRRRKALKISTKVSCEVCARPLSAPAATAAPAAAAATATAAPLPAGVLTFGCGHIFHGPLHQRLRFGPRCKTEPCFCFVFEELRWTSPRPQTLVCLPPWPSCLTRLLAAACGAWFAAARRKKQQGRRRRHVAAQLAVKAVASACPDDKTRTAAR